MEPTDEELAQRSQAGDADAFAELMRRHQASVFRIAYHMSGSPDDAEDLCQECFLKLHSVLPKYDRRLPFYPWFYRLTVNVCLEFARRKRSQPGWASLFSPRGQADQGGPVAELPSTAPTPEDELMTREQRRELLQALASLSPNYRAILVLRYLEGLSYKEVAEVLKVPERTVGVRLLRAKQMLRRRLEQIEEGER
ncbi:MAG: RNA polymerase sigma factor [Armatimonadota bacterium]